MTALTKVGVLVSGRGSNLEAILGWQRAGMLHAEVTVVICNHEGARALELARAHDVEARVYAYNRRDERERERSQVEMSALLLARGVGLVVLAGYDRVLVGSFVREWAGKIINVHPSLLPAFGRGLHAQADALAYGVKVSGCTVHFVTEDVDGGPVISQAAVPVLPDDDVDALSARILAQERRLLPAAIRLFGLGCLGVEGRRVVVRDV